MNPFRIFARILILPMLFAFIGSGGTAVAAGQPILITPVKQAETKITPSALKHHLRKSAGSQSPEDLPRRNIIGCALPLSGKFGDYGNKSLDAILFAAGIFTEKNKTDWKIVAEDSRGLPEGVKEAVAHLANTENVIAIIAVTGTAEAVEAAREAANQKVPLIMIAAKEGITNSSEFVFQHFLTPSQQIKALVKYALGDLNCAIFSILHPQDDYGVEMARIFHAETNSSGGKVESVISYSKSQTDFTDEISKFTRNNVGTAKNSKNQLPLNFEALFIPDSYQRVKMIASQLAFYDVKNVKLLGTSLWNSPNLLRKDAEYLDGAVFADSFFVNSFYPETNDFVDIYYTAYSREPETIEALAYDSMGMIINVLEDKNVQTRKQFIAALRQVGNYKGATGNTSFAGDRVSRKTAFILKVKDGKLEQVK